MKAALYRYDGPGFLRPLFHVVTDGAPPDCVEEVRRQHEHVSGAPVTVRRVASAEVRRPGRVWRAMRWLMRRAQA